MSWLLFTHGGQTNVPSVAVSGTLCPRQHSSSSKCYSTTGSAACVWNVKFPVSILYKSIAGHYRPVRVADGPITARYRFIKNANWVGQLHLKDNQRSWKRIPCSSWKIAEVESVSPGRKSSELHSLSWPGTCRLCCDRREVVCSRYIIKVVHNLEEQS